MRYLIRRHRNPGSQFHVCQLPSTLNKVSNSPQTSSTTPTFACDFLTSTRRYLSRDLHKATIKTRAPTPVYTHTHFKIEKLLYVQGKGKERGKGEGRKRKGGGVGRERKERREERKINKNSRT